jgi:poly-gamma-glutamate synthesis protein (capsule biosynthesis protein)
MSEVHIGFTGDFCPWERMEQVFLDSSWKKFLEPVIDFFLDNHFNIIDLECPLTTSAQKIPKTGPHIKALPDTAGILSFLNCKHVVTANNHFKDFGWKGMQDTYKSLSNEGISWIGSGANIDEASRGLDIEANGLKVHLLNMAEHEWSIAGKQSAGCNPIDYTVALRKIQLAKAQGCDFIVVVLHGGHEHYPLPSPRMKAQFRFMIDAGADAVVGHHTHIISGYEVYKGKPVFYSLGNFCFDWPSIKNSSWNKGMLLKLIFRQDRTISFQYRMILQNDTHVGLKYLDEDSANEQALELQRLNHIIQDDNALEQSFQKYCQTQEDIILARIQPYRNRYLVGLHKRGLLPDIMGSSKKRMLQILAQCESHREVLLATLTNKLNH